MVRHAACNVGGMSLDFETLFRATPAAVLVLAPTADFTIVAATDAYLSATMTTRDEIVGQALFTIFPDNPHDATATGTRNLRASLERVRASRACDVMSVQRYDVRRRSVVNDFEERHWSPRNEPVLHAGGEVSHILHRVEDVTAAVHAKPATTRVRITSSRDVATLRIAVREGAAACGLDPIAEMDLVVAASELGSNMVVHGGGGVVELERVQATRATGMRLRFHDDGPGVRDVESALAGGHSTAGTLGRGLSGARNLVDEFDLRTGGSGTTVTVAKWRR